MCEPVTITRLWLAPGRTSGSKKLYQCVPSIFSGVLDGEGQVIRNQVNKRELCGRCEWYHPDAQRQKVGEVGPAWKSYRILGMSGLWGGLDSIRGG